MLYANKRNRVERNIITRIHRNLIGQGQITVQVNQEVAPHDIIGISSPESGFRTMNVAKELNVAPSQVKKYLQRSIGQTIFKGELLALKPGGILQKQRVITAPSDSFVDLIDEKTGKVRLNFLQKKNEVPAAVFGVVEKIDTALGMVTIRTEVTKLHGILGSGKTRDGILRILGSRGDLINMEKINQADGGEIVVGGGLIYKDAINHAFTLGVNGIITGGINSADYVALSGGTLDSLKLFGTDIGVSVLVCEGFGSIPIGLDLYELLQKSHGKYAILDGNKGELILPTFDADCMIRIRNTRLPDFDDDIVKTDVQAVEISVGSKVRVIASPYTGEAGVVVFMDNTPTSLLSGLKTFMVTIETKSRKINVPYTNVEVI